MLSRDLNDFYPSAKSRRGIAMSSPLRPLTLGDLGKLKGIILRF